MEFIRDMSKKARPMERPPIVTTIRGPCVSFSLPVTSLNRPLMIQVMEKAPEVIALVQPNSFKTALKNIPKVLYAPHDIAIIKKEATTTMWP